MRKEAACTFLPRLVTNLNFLQAAASHGREMPVIAAAPPVCPHRSGPALFVIAGSLLAA